MKVHVLSGGAARALVEGLTATFKAKSGGEIEANFGAVGAMKERLLAGASADLVILSHSMVAELMREGHLAEGSDIDIGGVATGIAIRAADQVPRIGDAAALRDTLRRADAIHTPDPAAATAGRHFARILRQLGMASELAARVRTHPNGHAAMAALAADRSASAIGCTQVTEILGVAGVALAGLLPHELELVTVYTAAVSRRATEPDAARQLAEMLAGDEAAALRRELGFAGDGA